MWLPLSVCELVNLTQAIKVAAHKMGSKERPGGANVTARQRLANDRQFVPTRLELLPLVIKLARGEAPSDRLAPGIPVMPVPDCSKLT